MCNIGSVSMIGIYHMGHSTKEIWGCFSTWVAFSFFFALLCTILTALGHYSPPFQAIGIVIIGIGSWLVHTGNTFSVFIGNDFFSGAAILIMCGIIIFLITAFGIVAGMLEKKLLLYIVSYLFMTVTYLEFGTSWFMNKSLSWHMTT